MESTNDKLYTMPLWLSLSVTFFLFFIDEGYYDLRWMKDPGNWIVFIAYVGGLYLLFLLIGALGRVVGNTFSQRPQP